MTKRTSRGTRNNNPGNIRCSPTRYIGEKTPSEDPEFKQFVSIEWGYRALFVLLDAYRRCHGIDTIEKIISRYAPPQENDTENYIRFVSDFSNIPADRQIDTRSEKDMIPIANAICRMENGEVAKIETLKKGWNLFIESRK